MWDEYRYYGPPVSETAPDADMPTAAGSKAKSGGWMAELVDIRRAWHIAPHKRRLFMRYALGYTYERVAAEEGVSPQAVDASCMQAIEQILNYLNGEDSNGRTDQP